MPYFPDMHCVFVHIPKNAGRSIETAMLRQNASPDGGRRNLLNRAATYFSRKTAPKLAKTHLIGTLDVTLAAQHLTLQEMELLGLLPERRDFTSFCIVRNPYDRAISSVMHFSSGNWKNSENERERKSGFEANITRWLASPISDHNIRAHRRCQLDYLRDCSGKVAVDHILRFEKISEDFSELASLLGWNDIRIAHVGASGRQLEYKDYYNERTKHKVEQVFGQDLDEFGYSF